MRIPLRRAFGAVTMTALISLTLAACGDDDSDSPNTQSDEKTEQTDQAPEQADLDAAVLSAGDIPEGFEQTPVEDDEDDPDNPFNDTCYGELGDFDSRAGDPDAEAKTQFEASDASNFPGAEIKAGVAYYDDADDVAEKFTAFVEDIKSCTTVTTTTPDGLNINITLTTSDFSVPGADDGAKIVLSGTIASSTDSASLNASVIALRTGNYVANASTFEIDTFGLGAELDGLARTQFERVTGLAE